MYCATSNDIKVTIHVVFLKEQSRPEAHHYMWAYRVRIENLRNETVRLVRRYWKITDSLGRLHHIRGEGVIGQTPRLLASEHFEYTSGTPLSTPSGIMSGEYTMITDEGSEFTVMIPPFSLDSPHQPIILN